MNVVTQDPALMPLSIRKTHTAFQIFPQKLFCLAMLSLLIQTGCGESRSIAEADLDIPIMLKETLRGEPQVWLTLREWKIQLAENPNVEVEERFSKDGENFGLRLKFEDSPHEVVILFEKREGKLYPSLVGGDASLSGVKSKEGKFMVSGLAKRSITR